MQLTRGPQEEQDQDPVDPEQQESKEGDKGLQGEEREVDEDLSCHMEQSDGQSHTFPHEEHQQQQDDLRTGDRQTSGTTLHSQLQTNHEGLNLRFTYGEDRGGNRVDEQRLSAVPADSRLLLRLLHRFSLISVQPVVDVEPPEDAGTGWRDSSRQTM